MRFRKSREEDLRLGIAPLIDIVFLLLIFFMVTSHFDIASGVRIRLPKVANKSINDEFDNKVTLVIDSDGQIYKGGKKVDEKALLEDLKKSVEEKGLSTLILQADKDARHGRVVQVMDLAKRAGVQSIVIAAHWKTEKHFDDR